MDATDGDGNPVRISRTVGDADKVVLRDAAIAAETARRLVAERRAAA